MARTNKERVYLSRERKKLNLVHINDWTELEFASVYGHLKAAYADKSKKLWEEVKRLVEGYKG